MSEPTDKQLEAEEWMELNAFCEKFGERRNTVHKRVTDGLWPRGEFYASPSGGVSYIHVRRALDWLTEHNKLKA